MIKASPPLFVILVLFIIISCETTPFERKAKDRMAKDGRQCGIIMKTYTDSTRFGDEGVIVFSKNDYDLSVFNSPGSIRGTWTYSDGYSKITLSNIGQFNVVERTDKRETWRNQDGGTTSDWVLTKSN